MALKITNECINCDVCEPVCPNKAIYMGQDTYIIDPKKCTECIGHFDLPQCRILCPVNCITKNKLYEEDKKTLYQKFLLLSITSD